MAISGDYLKDASQFQGQADRLLLPQNEQEAADFLREANSNKTPVTFSGGGTGLTGGRVPREGAVLSTERLNRILKIDWDEKRQAGAAVVQPGVPLKELEAALEAKGLFYPPDPGEKAAFVGGTVATNASGSRSFKYGATRLYVERLRLLLADGSPLEVRRGGTRAENGAFAIVLSGGKTLSVPLPSYRMPAVKNAAGYYAAPGMDLVDLFVGSEGTLGLITEIELKIFKKPEALFHGILFFPSEKECVRFAAEARRMGREERAKPRMDPRALEFFDSRSLELLRPKHAAAAPDGAGAALLIEQECRAGEEPVLRQAWIEQAAKFGLLENLSRFSDRAADHAALRAVRYDLPVLVNEAASRNGFRKVGTDMAVPDAKGEEMLDFYLETLKRSGIDYVIFGHIGDNNLHVNLLPKTQRDFDRARDMYALFADKAVALGGTVSAEHGIGKLRISYLEKMVGQKGLKEMARVKLELDPNGLLNRGDIIPEELLKRRS